jgi:hypothetical protein
MIWLVSPLLIIINKIAKWVRLLQPSLAINVNVAIKRYKFIIYAASFGQRDLNILITEYETFEKKKICI